jgi:predicted RNA binding protein YcfA (HicA-like mRNA interferase family)
MRLPRGLRGKEFAKLVKKKYRYTIIRQTGSHIRLTTMLKGEHNITIPRHDLLKIGTLNSILKDLSTHLEKTKEEIVEELFEKS